MTLFGIVTHFAMGKCSNNAGVKILIRKGLHSLF